MKRASELEKNTESNAVSDMAAKPAVSGNGMLISLKVAYLIYVLPTVVLVGILFC